MLSIIQWAAGVTKSSAARRLKIWLHNIWMQRIRYGLPFCCQVS